MTGYRKTSNKPGNTYIDTGGMGVICVCVCI